jgi:predicted ester cyclase
VSVEENKEVVRREIEEVWAKRNLMVIDDLYDSNFVNHSPFPYTPPNREGIKQGIKNLLNAFPDIELTIDDLIAENDKVVERVTAIGTHKGEYMGIIPTNKRINLPVITINRFADDKIVERWSLIDSLAMLQQLGITLSTE